MERRQRYAMVVQYNGQNYGGSQIQPNSDTIQKQLEKALGTLTKKKIKVILSGRTDKGVHAIAQIAHFDVENELKSSFVNSMNGLLPQDISIYAVSKVDETFHAQMSAKYRWYRYEITNRAQRSAFDDRTLLVRYPLDVDRINESLKYLEGEHDFTSFKSLRTNNPAVVCEIYYVKAFKIGEKLVVDVVANRFLYNMIRIIIGTVLNIEKNSLAPKTLKEILDSKDRSRAGITMSPDGLKLMKVGYTTTFKEQDITQTIIMEKTIDENLFSKTS